MTQIPLPSLPELRHQGQTVLFRQIAQADLPFLFQLYASTREDVLSQPWPLEQKQAFLVQQFNAQHDQYQQHYIGAEFLILQVGGVDLGRMYLHRTRKEHRLMEVTLLPQYRKQGLGTALMHALMQQADAAGLPITLHVEQFNPAYQMYLRLGFQDVEQRGMYMFMQRPVPEGAVSQS
ncbi:GNAT family N-acetyltransferase [Deinococcus roseus]|uniref:N-acetyltransferase GCN5 n=1 Tax=Deinococcus roseus TaxID=392414 RepID=A0ABQ2D3W1_9DEIO|nr:GNAT family N-acetyltransferase [Deinococcus roseus]GGJ45033.1 N-acetyltransferase GCN5 [Deinococcus roseus]